MPLLSAHCCVLCGHASCRFGSMVFTWIFDWFDRFSAVPVHALASFAFFAFVCILLQAAGAIPGSFRLQQFSMNLTKAKFASTCLPNTHEVSPSAGSKMQASGKCPYRSLKPKTSPGLLLRYVIRRSCRVAPCYAQAQEACRQGHRKARKGNEIMKLHLCTQTELWCSSKIPCYSVYPSNIT
jgi:hypothetical protein